MGGEIKFNTSEVPTDLATQRIGESFLLSENLNILIANLKKPRFSGFIIKFGYYFDVAEFEEIKQNRYARWKVLNPITKQYHYGWIKNLKLQVRTDEANIELLEEFDGIDGTYETVMIDHEFNYIATDNNEKITVNE